MIATLLDSGRFEKTAEGIYSSLPASERPADYDTKVTLYDMLIGNGLYNRLLWGNRPSDYAAFCQKALDAVPGGSVLDAGCGSLVFTAATYAKEAGNRPLVLLDRSIGMLQKGRRRLKKLMGKIPDTILFVQGDVFDLPFEDSFFDTVLAQGIVHMFDEKERLLHELSRVKKPDAPLYFTSLVANNTLGKRYLGQLQKAGEVAGIHSGESLKKELAGFLEDFELESIGNMAYVTSR